MKAPEDHKQAYTVQEAGAAYGTSPDVIRAHIKSGNLVARYPSSRPVIGADELKNWFNSLPTEAA